MKKILVILSIAFFVFLFPISALATGNGEEIYSDIWNRLDPQVKEMFSSLGIDALSAGELTKISPSKVFSMLGDIFTGEMISPMKTAVICFVVMLAVTFISNFFPDESSFKEMGESVGIMCVMFTLIASAGAIFADCCSSLLVSKDFMLLLIPILAGIITAAGKPSLALSINSMVFTFAESLVLLFQKVIPALSVSGTAAAAAATLNPMMKFSGIGRIIPKAAAMLMGFMSGIFVAIMSIRGIIAGAADTVTIKGLRFLVGNTVPIVGTAIGDALNSVVAGLGLIKHTVGMFGIVAIIAVIFPAVIKVVVWKLALFFLGVAADMFDNSKIKSFTENLSGVFSLILAAIFFTAFVFVVSIAILITVSKE